MTEELDPGGVLLPINEAPMGGEGTMGAFLWPVYVGLMIGEPDPACRAEPFYHPDYQRGQITWGVRPESKGKIVGRATVHVPSGNYLFLTYHYGPGIWPAGPQLMGYRQLEFGLCFPTAAAVAIDPINEGDWIQRPRGLKTINGFTPGV